MGGVFTPHTHGIHSISLHRGRIVNTPPARPRRGLSRVPVAPRPRHRTREARGGQWRPPLARTRSPAAVARLHREGVDGRLSGVEADRVVLGLVELALGRPTRWRTRPGPSARHLRLLRVVARRTEVRQQGCLHSCEEASTRQDEAGGRGREKARAVEFERAECRRDGRTRRHRLALQRRTWLEAIQHLHIHAGCSAHSAHLRWCH
jgi:hypothetical protein